MNVTIYLDVFIIENLIINYFLLMITSKIVRKKLYPWRTLIAAGIGTLYGIIALMIKNEFFSGLLMKGVISFLMVAVACYHKNTQKRNWFKYWGVFIFSSFILCGVAVFIHISMGKGTIFKGMILNFTAKKIVLAVFLVFIFFERIFYYINSRRIEASYIFQCQIHKNGITYEFDGLIDTGNFLKEPISGKDVVIVQEDIFELFHEDMENGYRIPYSCVDSSRECLYALEPDFFFVKEKEGKKTCLEGILVGYSGNSFQEEFQGILPGSVLNRLT